MEGSIQWFHYHYSGSIPFALGELEIAINTANELFRLNGVYKVKVWLKGELKFELV